MPDDTSSDRKRINVDDDASLSDWARKFDVTAEQIRDAVGAVGDRADDVELHLKGSRATTNAEKEQSTKR